MKTILSALLSCCIVCSWAQNPYNDLQAPFVFCEDLVVSLAGDCSYPFVFDGMAVDTPGCTLGSELRWLITVDQGINGTVDYAGFSDLGAEYEDWKINEEQAAIHGLPPSTLWIAMSKSLSGEKPKLRTGELFALPDLVPLSDRLRVSLKVWDACHNYASCMLDVEGQNVEPPVLEVVDTVDVTLLMEGDQHEGTAKLKALDLVSWSSDDCTSQGGLIYGFDILPVLGDTIFRDGQLFIINTDVPHYFDEKGFVDFDGLGTLFPEASESTKARYIAGGIYKWLPSENTVELVVGCRDWPCHDLDVSVWDEQLNRQRKNALMRVTGYLGGCHTFAGRYVEAEVLTREGKLKEDADIYVETELCGWGRDVPLIFIGPMFSRNLSTESEVYLHASCSGPYLEGVSTFDIIKIQRALAGIDDVRGYDALAADVNGDLEINAMDVGLLRQRLLGKETIADQDSWKVVQSNDDVTDIAEFDAEYYLPASSEDQLGNRFTAVKMGDVNNSLELAEAQIERSISLDYEDRFVEPGEVFEVAFESADYEAVLGLQLGLRLKDVELIDVLSDDLDVSLDNFGPLTNGLLTFSYSNYEAKRASQLFRCVFKAQKRGWVGEMIMKSRYGFKAEAYFEEEGAVVVGEVSMQVRQSFDNSFFALQPNPSVAHTLMTWTQKANGIAKVSVYDMLGKEHFCVSGEYAAGRNEMLIELDDNVVSGMYVVVLEIGDYVATRKLIYGL